MSNQSSNSKSTFKRRLMELGFQSYAGYLQSDTWRCFKQRYRSAGLPVCCAVCQVGPIQLHHHTYIRLGVEELGDVTPLCRDHHVQVHACLKTKHWRVENTDEAIRLLQAGSRFDDSLVIKRTPSRQQSLGKRRRKKNRRQRRAELKKRGVVWCAFKIVDPAAEKARQLLQEAKEKARQAAKIMHEQLMAGVKPPPPSEPAKPCVARQEDVEKGRLSMRERLRGIRSRKSG